MNSISWSDILFSIDYSKEIAGLLYYNIEKW